MNIQGCSLRQAAGGSALLFSFHRPPTSAPTTTTCELNPVGRRLPSSPTFHEQPPTSPRLQHALAATFSSPCATRSAVARWQGSRRVAPNELRSSLFVACGICTEAAPYYNSHEEYLRVEPCHCVFHKACFLDQLGDLSAEAVGWPCPACAEPMTAHGCHKKTFSKRSLQ